MGIFLCLLRKHNPTCGKNKKEKEVYKMKRFLSILLAVLMLAVMLPVTAMADEAPAGYTENGNSVSISDEDGLKWFAQQVNTGNTYEGKTVTLTNDVTVSNWIPIGQKKNENNRFKGTFDGNGETVTTVSYTHLTLPTT